MTSDKIPGLLKLPPELRSNIYAELLSSQRNRQPLPDQFYEYTFHTGILQTNKQIHKEAKEVFRRKNVFVYIATPWRQAEEQTAIDGRVPLLAVGERADEFEGVHMQVSVDVPDMRYPRSTMSKFIVCVEDLDAFCKMWFYSDLTHSTLHTTLNSHLRLRLRVFNLNPDVDIPKSLQRSLLFPFVQIKGLSEIVIEGPVDEGTVAEFRKLNAVPYETPESCLAKCNELKEAGNAESKAGRYHEAIRKYEAAFYAMHIVVSGRRRQAYADNFFDKTLEDGAFNKQDGSLIRTIFRIQLVADMLFAHLKLEDYDTVQHWGNLAISNMREYVGDAAMIPRSSFPAANEWGTIWYRTALASEALGNTSQAREYLRIAAQWLPNDKTAQQKYQSTALRLM